MFVAADIPPLVPGERMTLVLVRSLDGGSKWAICWNCRMAASIGCPICLIWDSGLLGDTRGDL